MPVRAVLLLRHEGRAGDRPGARERPGSEEEVRHEVSVLRGILLSHVFVGVLVSILDQERYLSKPRLCRPDPVCF